MGQMAPPPRSPGTTGRGPNLATLSCRGAAPGLPRSNPGSKRREEPGNGGGGGGGPQPRARRRRGRRLPPETRSRCALRCQHSWKVTPSRREGRGLSPLPDVQGAQLPPANKVSSWLRRAAHTPAASAWPAPARALPGAGGRPRRHGGGPEPPPHPPWGPGWAMGRWARPGEVGTPPPSFGRSKNTQHSYPLSQPLPARRGTPRWERSEAHALAAGAPVGMGAGRLALTFLLLAVSLQVLIRDPALHFRSWPEGKGRHCRAPRLGSPAWARPAAVGSAAVGNWGS